MTWPVARGKRGIAEIAGQIMVWGAEHWLAVPSGDARVAHFDLTARTRAAFAAAHHGRVTEEYVLARIADCWTVTRWVTA